MGFPTPKVFVTADSVENGKPDPEGKCVFFSFFLQLALSQLYHWVGDGSPMRLCLS